VSSDGSPTPQELVARAARGDAAVVLHRHAYSTSAPIDLLVPPGARTPSGVLRKDLSPGSLLPTARATKPDFLLDPRREVAVYRDVLPPWLESPMFHGAVEDGERRWLFLEHVDGIELWQVGDLAVWTAVARWAASLHAAHLEEDAPPTVRSLLVDYDADFYRRWAKRAAAFAGYTDRRLEPVLARHEEVVERLLAMPSTFVHGELYPSNVLVVETPEPRVAVIDWETAAVGPPLVDLAALVEGWDDEARRVLVDAYRQALGAVDPTAADAVTDDGLDACRLHLCIRWLGWAPAWAPPEDHDHDWLALALELTERLR